MVLSASGLMDMKKLMDASKVFDAKGDYVAIGYDQLHTIIVASGYSMGTFEWEALRTKEYYKMWTTGGCERLVDTIAIWVWMLHECESLFGSEQFTNFEVLVLGSENYMMGPLLRGVYMADCLDFCRNKILNFYFIFRSDFILF